VSPFTFNSRSFGVWFGGIFLLVGLSLFVVSVFLFYDDWRFSQEARSTQGTVLTKAIRQSHLSTRSDGDRTPKTHYEVTYSFTAEGETIEGRDELSRDEWERLREHGPVEVLYRPERPSSNRLAGHRSWLLKTLFGLIGSVFSVLGGTVLARTVRQARLEERLRHHGVSTQGTVIELRERNVTVNDVRLWRLHYEYRDFQTHRHVKTVDLLEDEAQQWKVGDVGKVLYESERPTEAVWLGREVPASDLDAAPPP
jgi:hypothetical protein